EAMFAIPWPQLSLVLLEWVSVTASTSLAVINDSMSPTSAIARAYGAMMDRVSIFHGTSGIKSVGRLRGNSPLSPTVGALMAKTAAIAVITTMDTRGAGTALVSFGKKIRMSRPR